MGTTALIVFLGSLGLGMLCLFILVFSALRIYRTLRYGYKDLQPWLSLYKEYMDTLSGTLHEMELRAQNVTAAGMEMRETVDDIQDAIEELRSHSLLRTARFLGRFRR
jgi:hypothetical protein